MAVDYVAYKNTIKTASQNARQANSIDEALEIQAAGYALALQVAVSQMLVNTNVVTTGSASSHTGTGTGIVT